MKKILKGLFILLFIVLLSACSKNYKELSYTKFIDTFNSEKSYLVNDQILILDDEFERQVEASGKNNQFLFYEFKTEEEARDFVSKNYKNLKYYKYKDKKEYITVKSTKDGYFYLIQVKKTVLIGDTDIKSNKKEIMRIFKSLGY